MQHLLSKITFSSIAILAILVFSACRNPVDSQRMPFVEYEWNGGYTGHEFTTIDASGAVRSIYENSYLVAAELDNRQLQEIKAVFDLADFSGLQNSYRPTRTIEDGNRYRFAYTENNLTKNVSFETGAPIPPGLSLLRDFFLRFDNAIKAHPEVFTLRIHQEWSVLDWPFSDAFWLAENLNKNFEFTSAEISKEIYAFLYAASETGPDGFLLREGGFLYQLSWLNLSGVLEDDLGKTFNPQSQLPFRFLPENVGFEISELAGKGKVFSGGRQAEIAAFIDMRLWSGRNIFAYESGENKFYAANILFFPGQPIK